METIGEIMLCTAVQRQYKICWHVTSAAEIFTLSLYVVSNVVIAVCQSIKMPSAFNNVAEATMCARNGGIWMRGG